MRKHICNRRVTCNLNDNLANDSPNINKKRRGFVSKSLRLYPKRASIIRMSKL